MDGLLETLGTNAEDLFQADNITKKEEEDLILEKIKGKYGFKDIKDSMDEGIVLENFFSMDVKVTIFIVPSSL